MKTLQNIIQKQWFLWAVIILVIINISMIAGFTYKAYIADNTVKVDTSSLELPDQGWGPYFRDKLNLSHKQFRDFLSSRQEFHTSAMDITIELQSTRIGLLEEMSKPKPDTKKINRLAKKIGQLHTELKKVTVDYYLALKKECNPQQKKQLYKIFKQMLNAEELDLPEGRRHRHRRGRGFRFRGNQN